MIIKSTLSCLIVFSLLSSSTVFSKEPVKKEETLAGELFGTPVPLSNYYFVKSTVAAFGNKWGTEPKSQSELDDIVWDNLLLSFEAFRRDIVVTKEEVDEEITKTVKAEKTSFDWKKNRREYAKWLKDRVNANETPELFENQMRHMIQIQKLRQQVMDSIAPTVKDEEAYQEFLNEYNTLGLELVEFDKKEDAQSFYQKVKTNPALWEEEKNKRPKDFKRPGFVSLEFLIEMWGLPKEAVYSMMSMEVGQIYLPAPIYKGYGVFQILEKRPADLSKYPSVKDSYYQQIKMKKKYTGLNDWVKNLREEAKVKRYERGSK